MTNETDRQIRSGEFPIDGLAESLDEKDSETVATDVLRVCGLTLDELGFSDIDDSERPVRITIEPDYTDDDTYGVHYEPLTEVEQDGETKLISDRHMEYVEQLADELRELDCLVPSEIDEIPDVETYGSFTQSDISLVVEAMENPLDSEHTDSTSWLLPDALIQTLEDHDATITELAFSETGNGWGHPAYSLFIEI